MQDGRAEDSSRSLLPATRVCSGTKLLHGTGSNLLPTGGVVLLTGTDLLRSGSELLSLTSEVLARCRHPKSPINQARANGPGFFAQTTSGEEHSESDTRSHAITALRLNIRRDRRSDDRRKIGGTDGIGNEFPRCDPRDRQDRAGLFAASVAIGQHAAECELCCGQ